MDIDIDISTLTDRHETLQEASAAHEHAHAARNAEICALVAEHGDSAYAGVYAATGLTEQFVRLIVQEGGSRDTSDV